MGRPSKSPAKKPVAKKATKSPVKKNKRAKKDPNAPKRAQSGYMLWLQANRASLTKPGMGVTDVAKAAGEVWRGMKDKTKWDKAAAKDKERYAKEMVVYKKKSK
eukprot:27597_1